MSITPRRPGLRAGAPRRGFTMKESIAVVVIVIVVLAVVFPSITLFRERARRLECESHLRKIGQAIDRYASNDSLGELPIGSRFDAATHSAGTSWWLDVLANAEGEKLAYHWQQHTNSGDFNHGNEVNLNTAFADGFQSPLFYCPTSPLPRFNDPQRHMSEANRSAIKDRRPTGIAVPMYTAVAGGAPDLRGILGPKFDVDHPAGRNTNEGPWGILSGSGVFPPNRRMRRSAIFDQKDKTIMIVEQSDYARDATLEPAALFDVRNSWPRGAFMGTSGNYDEPNLMAPNLNGDGAERCWNITTVRYPINTRDIKQKRGIFTDPAPPRADPDGVVPPTPPYPEEGYGPGHNNPIISSHPEGANVLMADGSVHHLNEKLDLGILLRMSTRDDKVNIEE